MKKLEKKKKKNPPNKKEVKHEKDEAQEEAVIDSFGKKIMTKKIWNYLFLACKLD
jgi:hypothetical protein